MFFMKDSERLVYSSEAGRICKECQQPSDRCTCKASSDKPIGNGQVRVQRESKGRKGKTVTVITGLPLSRPELQALAKSLKGLCGCGGTIKGGVIEIQGDHRDRLLKALQDRGFTAKIAGG